MAEYLKKPFKDSLGDIKERMKEKRNQKWIRLSKINQISNVKCKIATNSSMQMKSVQANNRALALALQEEKLKLREAQTTILHLREEYQGLKVQMFDLQRKLRFEQAQGSVEVFLNQRVFSSVLENNSGLKMNFHLQLQGQTSDFHLDNAASELENVSTSEEDRQFGNTLPKSVSTRRRCSKMRTHDELCTGVLDHSETPDSTRELSKRDEIRLEESLEKCTVENMSSDISRLNKNKVGSELVLRQVDSATAQFNSDNIPDFKQHERKSREDSQVRREKRQKAKLEGTKNTSRPRSKKRQGKETSKEKLDFLGGCSDAYDFHFEECVHVTPFRQNKVNDTDAGVDDKKDLPETDSTESSNIEEDSDDSLYVPYMSKSKKRKSSVGKKDISPIHARPRSKRCLAQREQKLQNEKETQSSKSSDKSISKLGNCAVIIVLMNALVVPEVEGSPAPKRKRSCTLTVSYKEPSIAGKLRRGDPFTDTCFLNSPIFKQKKDAKHHSVKKESLSKYNEKFVGCR
uniref:Shugoshin 1 n=1 Tax=Dromaius novaehollandiae TaxID=8790 RepID=A0A8C4K3E8_DRONO